MVLENVAEERYQDYFVKPAATVTPPRDKRQKMDRLVIEFMDLKRE